MDGKGRTNAMCEMVSWMCSSDDEGGDLWGTRDDGLHVEIKNKTQYFYY